MRPNAGDLAHGGITDDHLAMRKATRQATPWKGHVYVLVNPAMPGLVKVGFTSRPPNERLKELNSATGVPAPFEMAGSVWSRNGMAVEAKVHRLLDAKRINRKREFFRCSPAEALAAAGKAAKEVPGSRFLRTSARPSPVAAAAVCLAGSGWLAAWHPALAVGWAAACLWSSLTGRPASLTDLVRAVHGHGAAMYGMLAILAAAGWIMAMGRLPL